VAEPARKQTRIRPELRRAQILNEAVRLIGERGNYGFSIQELAQRRQLTNPGLLHYFGSKDKLLMALLEDRDRRDAEIIPGLAGLAGRSARSRAAKCSPSCTRSSRATARSRSSCGSTRSCAPRR
jgi:AcrR family transcriptional regulator